MKKATLTFNDAVVAKGSGTFGTLTVTDGNVKKGQTVLLTFFGDKTVLIPLNARATFTVPQEHVAFDGLLFALMTAQIGVQYVDNIRSFLNPDNRFKEFMGMTQADAATFNTNFSLGLTADELRLTILTKSAKSKFAKVFFMTRRPGPDVAKLFSQANQDQIERIEKWLDGTGTRPSISVNNPRVNNLLRINNNRVETLAGYSITKNQFERGYKVIREALDRGNKTAYLSGIANYDYRSRQMQMDGDVVKIGCQEHPLSEVLRIAEELGL